LNNEFGGGGLEGHYLGLTISKFIGRCLKGCFLTGKISEESLTSGFRLIIIKKCTFNEDISHSG
jgi:hypothetical protein